MNPQSKIERSKAYYKAHPEKTLAHAKRRRALKQNAPVIEPVDRQAVILRDHSTCYLCNRVLQNNEITLDHVIPLARGGWDTESNLKVACRSCNCRKKNKLLSELNPEFFPALQSG
jgi:5-methylcytosine-specific restriction protein A